MTAYRTEARDHALARITIDIEAWLDNALATICGGDPDLLGALYLERTDGQLEADKATAEWVTADGADDWSRYLAAGLPTLAETEPAPPEMPVPPAETLLNRVQFLSMLAILGIDMAAIEAAIEAVIADPTEQVIAKIRARESLRYAREHPLIAMLAPSFDLTDEAIDAAWEQALAI